MNVLALIPARMGSSRFPGKPMAPILGKPMIGHVYERVAKSPRLSLTAVATCDKEIYDYIESIGGVLTDADKSDADYAVAKEKCDALSGDAKDACLDRAKTAFGRK